MNRVEEVVGTTRPSGVLIKINGRRETICIFLAAAEVCWVTPVLLALFGMRNPHAPTLLWLGILILMLGYFYSYRALVAANLALRFQQGLLVAGLLLSIGLILRFHVLVRLQGIEYWLEPFRHLDDVMAVMSTGWMAVVILVYLWARAIHLADRSLLADDVGFSFRAGVVILIAAALVVRLLTRLDVSGFVVPYFFFSLGAVALARIEEVKLQADSGGGRGLAVAPFGGFWIGATVAAVAILVLLGVVVAVFFCGGGLEEVLRWLFPVWIALQILIVGVATLLFLLVNWLFDLLSIDWSIFSEGLQDLMKRLIQLARPWAAVPPPGSEASPRLSLLDLLQAAVIILIPLLIVSLVLLWTSRRLRRSGANDQAGEARESLLSARAVANSLQAMLRGGLDRLAELAGLLGRFGPTSRFLAAVSIRRIYANLMRLGAEAGYPRHQAQTPYEYLESLYQALPGSEEDVTVITEAYVQAHYGQLPDSLEELKRIRACWERAHMRKVERGRSLRR